MLSFKKHIALFSLWVFLVPTAISLHHTLEDHEHNTICHSKGDHHIHNNIGVDCELCDFTKSTFLTPTFELELSANSLATKLYPNNYTFLTTFKGLFFSLRGPPTLV